MSNTDNKIPTWDETVEVKDQKKSTEIPSWDETTELKKKVGSEISSEDSQLKTPGTDGLSDFEKQSQQITEQNKNFNFVQRALTPDKFPSIKNEDGTTSTHKLARGDDGKGNYFVYPTIIQDKSGKLKELNDKDAFDYAMQSGEYIKTKDKKLADYYSKQGLIKHPEKESKGSVPDQILNIKPLETKQDILKKPRTINPIDELLPDKPIIFNGVNVVPEIQEARTKRIMQDVSKDVELDKKISPEQKIFREAIYDTKYEIRKNYRSEQLTPEDKFDILNVRTEKFNKTIEEITADLKDGAINQEDAGALIADISNNHKKLIEDLGAKEVNGNITIEDKYYEEVFSKQFKGNIDKVIKKLEKEAKDPYMKDLAEGLASSLLGIAGVGASVAELTTPLALAHLTDKELPSKFFTRKSMELQEKAQYYDQNIVDYLQQGEIGKATGATLAGIVQTIPDLLLVALNAPAGLINFGAKSGQREVYKMQREQPETKDVVKFLKAYGYGLAEMLPEMFGTVGTISMVKKSMKNVGIEETKKLMAEAIKPTMERALTLSGNMMYRGAMGAADEMTTSLVQQTIDGEYNANEMISEGIVGFIMDAGITSASIPKQHLDKANIREKFNSIPEDYSYESKAELTGLLIEEDYLREQKRKMGTTLGQVVDGKLETIQDKILDIASEEGFEKTPEEGAKEKPAEEKEGKKPEAGTEEKAPEKEEKQPKEEKPKSEENIPEWDKEEITKYKSKDAPKININAIDLEQSGLAEIDEKDVQYVKILEYRGRNNKGIPVGTVVIAEKFEDGSFNINSYEVFFNDKLKEEPKNANEQQSSEVRKTGDEQGEIEGERNKNMPVENGPELRNRETPEEEVIISPEGKSHEEYARDVAEKSTNPDQLHEVYKKEVPPYNKLNDWQQDIVSGEKKLLGNINGKNKYTTKRVQFNEKSLKTYLSKDDINQLYGRGMVSKKGGEQLDTFGEDYGGIDPQNISNFLEDMLHKRVSGRKTTDIQRQIRKKYKEVTGNSIDTHNLQKEAENENLTDEENNDLEKLDDKFIEEIKDAIDIGSIRKDNIDQLSWLWDTKEEFELVKQILQEYEPKNIGEVKEPEETSEAFTPQGKGKPGTSERGKVENQLNDEINSKQKDLEKAIKSKNQKIAEFNDRRGLFGDRKVENEGEKLFPTQTDFSKESLNKYIQSEEADIRDLKDEIEKLKKNKEAKIKEAEGQKGLWEEEMFAKKKKTKGKPSEGKGMKRAEPVNKEYRKKENKKRWIDDEKMTEQALKGIPIPELIQIYKRLSGKFPVLKTVKGALGKFKHIPGSDMQFIEIDYSLIKDPEMLARVLAHEIGHYLDYLDDKTLSRGNILGRISSAREYFKSLLAEKPGKEDTVLDDEDRKRIRKQAKEELKAEYEKGITEIIEEVIEEIPIFEQTGLTAEDIRAIWNDNSSRGKFPTLYDYIAKLSAKAKANVMKQAIKGIVAEEIQRLGGAKQVGTKKVKTIKKTIVTPDPVTRENIAKRFGELINEEINKRRLFDNEVITEELKNLTKWWNPFNDAIDKTYADYRFTSRELYAEALSVFLNNPDAVAERAPYFFRAFTNYMGTKPSFKQVYTEMQDLLSKEKEELFKDRIRRSREAFEKGKEARKGIMEEETKKLGFFDGIGKELFSKSIPITRKIKKLTHKILNKGANDYQILKNALEKTHFMREQVGVFVREIEQNIIKELEKNKLSIDDFGEILTYEREMNDQTRKERGNPLGYMEQDAAELRAYIYDKYSPAQANVMKNAVQYFHDKVFEIMTAANRVGIISDKVFKDIITPNKDFYATFAIIKYIDKNYISPYLHQVKGTFEEHENPLISTLLKTASMIKLINRQTAILTLKNVYGKHLPDEISVKDDEGHKKDMAYLPFKENGSTKYLEVDKWVADFFEFDPDYAKHTLKIFQYFHSVFKPAVTTFNMSFAFFSNIFRDSPRTIRYIYTLLSQTEGISKGEALNYTFRYFSELGKGGHEAKLFINGELTPLVKEMMQEGVLPSGFFGSYDAYANDAMMPFLSSHNLISSTKTFREKLNEIPVLKSIMPILEFIEYRGSIIEAMPKIIAYKLYKEALGSKELAALYTRNYAGTPNYRDRGNLTRYVNQIFPFSNVILQALRSDSHIAFGPATAGAYWMQTAATVMVPALTVALASLGAFGDDIEKMFDAIPEYDKTNYLCIPLGWKKNGKVHYIRIPIDEYSRFIYAMTYKAAKGAGGEFTKPEQIFVMGRGLLPSASPLVETARVWSQFAQRENPYDNFYGSNILTDKENILRNWGTYKKMMLWSFENMGGQAVAKFFDYDPIKKTTSEYILQNVPIVKRAYKSSDYGLSEIRREEMRKVEKEHYKFIDQEDKLIDKTTRELIINGKAEDASVNELAVEIVDEIYKDDIEGKDRKSYIKAKIKIKLGKGLFRDHSTIIDDLYRKSNKEKEAAIYIYANQFGPEQTRDMLQIMVDYGIISKEFNRGIKNKLEILYPE